MCVDKKNVLHIFLENISCFPSLHSEGGCITSSTKEVSFLLNIKFVIL
jgi:hypothetical protein